VHVVDFLQLSAIPIVLFGVLLKVALRVAAGNLAVGVFFDGFQHLNLSIDYQGPFWRTLDGPLNSPHFHAWHHNDQGHRCDGNYGNSLTTWDRLFGSDVTHPELPAGLDLTADQVLYESIFGLQLCGPISGMGCGQEA